ncbi:MAG: glycosyltransferase family 2 protein [Pseudomonadota bacterium]
MAENSGVYIVLLNWNGWRDTIACLESLLPDINRGARVVVCDNESADNSLEHIRAWSQGRLQAGCSGNPRLDRLQQHKLARPLTRRISWDEAELGMVDKDAQLILIGNGANLGFAGGNNVGLRFAMLQKDMTHVWLLNNDTLVEPDCLREMRKKLALHGGPAVCGSVIHFFEAPEVIQCIGGNRFDTRNGRALQSEGRHLNENDLPAMATVENRIDYLSGCSMLLPRGFLEGVGLMNEEYFLYYEEIDWFTRAKGRFDLLVAREARLYHREGGSIGSRSLSNGPSLLSDLHMFRSRLSFMRRYYPKQLWRCIFFNWVDAGKSLVKGRWRNAAVIARVNLQGKEVSAPAP